MEDSRTVELKVHATHVVSETNMVFADVSYTEEEKTHIVWRMGFDASVALWLGVYEGATITVTVRR